MANIYPRYPVGHIVTNLGSNRDRAPLRILQNTAVVERGGVSCAHFSHRLREKDAGRRELISEPDSLWKGCVEVKFDGEGFRPGSL
jgi:hypothetical protein